MVFWSWLDLINFERIWLFLSVLYILVCLCDDYFIFSFIFIFCILLGNFLLKIIFYLYFYKIFLLRRVIQVFGEKMFLMILSLYILLTSFDFIILLYLKFIDLPLTIMIYFFFMILNILSFMKIFFKTFIKSLFQQSILFTHC